ncbi:hypothetical protein Geu3261_0105_004 [Komagataeibacter europaeus NBRC 3261]|uniref:Uncharacterized protein n=1 Tax=Komagataeibacter europaeus NBRC 3261 TaxID=1234669 RepID=A0A0D6Q214_KOMEU|nr:transposase [Komagataeibacter europaeus]GAN96801.1 hypothetical protein Geu3261_0105_004 [Komagataeibacter europaeus NBRC 3261]
MIIQITSGMKTIIWLAHKYGAVKLRACAHKLMWAPGDGCALIDTTTYQTNVMQRRGLIRLKDGATDTFVLTALGQTKAEAMWFEPPRVRETRRQSGSYWLTTEQMHALKPWLPAQFAHLRSDDRRLLSGIVHALRENLTWQVVSGEYGPELALRQRWAQWCRSGAMDNALGHLFEQDADGQPRLVVTTAMLMRHRSGARAIECGYLPTFTPIDEMEAA